MIIKCFNDLLTVRLKIYQAASLIRIYYHSLKLCFNFFLFYFLSAQTVISQQEFTQMYTVGTMLGKGGFGTVYAGFRKADQLPVAIKSVSKNRPLILLAPDTKCDRERFVPVEVALMQQVTHVSGVIRLIDYFELPDCFMIVMERMCTTSTGSGSCKDLFDFISDSGPIKEELAKYIFSQIVTTIQQVHASGVVHRDVKDENILIDTRTYKVRLIDFGSGAKLNNEVYTDFDGKFLQFSHLVPLHA